MLFIKYLLYVIIYFVIEIRIFFFCILEEECYYIVIVELFVKFEKFLKFELFFLFVYKLVIIV